MRPGASRRISCVSRRSARIIRPGSRRRRRAARRAPEKPWWAPNVRNAPSASNELNGLIVPTAPIVLTGPIVPIVRTAPIGLIVPTGPIVRIVRPEFPRALGAGAEVGSYKKTGTK